ncbi:MAG: AAA family ATPase [Candidatus Magasanikbacteria bacterium]
MSNKIILGFVGDLASGKGTLAKYLQEKYNCNTYRFSNMLRDVLDRIYVEKNRENMQLVSKVLRENFGQDVMSNVIAKDVVGDKNELVVVDGIRRPTDITYLQNLEGFHLIYITADVKTRWQRMVNRQENPDEKDKTFEQFLLDEQAEADMLIKELGSKAEKTINNDGTIEELYNKIENILESYGHKN